MKLRGLIISGVVVVVGSIIGILMIHANGDPKATQKDSVKKLTVAANACEVFRMEDAKNILGQTAEKPEGAEAPPASSDDINVSQCAYQTPIKEVADIKTQRQASLLARAAKSAKGETSNKAVFDGTSKPAGVQDVAGYGDAAYWNPQYGQLNILKSHNWYVLQVGGIAPNDRNADDAKKMADTIVDRL